MATINGTSTKEIALDLARRRMRVFPIKARGKTPATQHGCNDATSDELLVKNMFSGRTDLNIGIATGPNFDEEDGVERGIFVLDVEADGIAAFEAINAAQPAVDQIWAGNGRSVTTVRTGGGGLHFYFAIDEGEDREIRCSTKIGGLPIDIRGAGGYVVAPPSIHASGNRYEWIRDLDQLSYAPDWVLNLATSKTLPEIASKITTPVVEPITATPAITFEVGTGSIDDLATAAGVGKGDRHNAALRLIGSAIGRGLDLVEVANQAIAWAKRCSPPLDDEEVLRVVSDLSRSQTIKVETQIEDEPLPDAIAWPKLDEAAIYGLAGDIVRRLEPHTEADSAAILIQVLAMFGNLVGREPYFMVEGTRHHCNLFAVLVGSTARGRKGTSEGRVRSIFAGVCEEWAHAQIKTGLTSGEGLIWSVRDPIYKLETIKDKGRVVGTEEVLADPGVIDKRLLVVEPEFAAVLRVCKRETNTLSPTLRSAWDSGTIRTMAKNSPAKATAAHISIVGHITGEELRRSLDEVEGFNGFSNRFLWLAVRRSKLLPDGGLDLDLSSIVNRLTSTVAIVRSAKRMRRTKAAAALWRTIYFDLADDSASGLLAAVTSRAEAQVLRLSMIYALLDESDTINVDHLEAGLAVWRYCRASAALIFGTASGDGLEDKVLSSITSTPGVSRWQLHSTICKHKPAAVLVGILARLRDAGKIRPETITTSGRSAECWFPAERIAIAEPEKREVWELTIPDPGLTSDTSLTSQGSADNGERFDPNLSSHTSLISHEPSDNGDGVEEFVL